MTIRDELFNKASRFCWNPDCSYLVPITSTICTRCAWTADGSPVPSPATKAVPRAKAVALEVERDMNKTEARYKAHLEGELAASRIAFFDFECFKLRLADACQFIPDFMVVDADGYIELHDVKARWKSTGKAHIEDDAMVKLKGAAEKYPFFRVFAVWEEDGLWKRREF